MGLFQKKILPIVSQNYQYGHQDSLLIVGLGNSGDDYENTRHNAGFAVLDEFARTEDFNPWVDKKDMKSILCAKIIDGKKVILCKPTTMMNLSGEAVQAVQKFYKIPATSTVVIYDELDLELGTIRSGSSGQSAGHNGIKSLMQHTENNFWRIRVGIGPKSPEQMDTADFVLQHFSKDQLTALKSIKKEALSLLNEWVAGSAKPDTRKV
jgi:peptidyl-tRNA hydrolase, PTH1 family